MSIMEKPNQNNNRETLDQPKRNFLLHLKLSAFSLKKGKVI